MESKPTPIQQALSLYQEKKFTEALDILEQSSAKIADSVNFYKLKGLCLSEINEHDEAVKCFVEAVKLAPLDPMPYTNIGNSLAKNLQFEEADKYFDLALTVEPGYAEAFVGKGVAAFQRLDYPSAEKAFEQALAIRPGHLTVETNLGNCYSVQGKYDPALELLDRSVARDPENGLARTNRGLIHLVKGNFNQGWEDYEYRFDSGNMMPNRFQQIPRWPGPNSPSSNVLIWAEQGLGDEIMFSTIFPDLAKLPHTFYIECDPRLFEIFRTSFPGLHFVKKRTITGVDSIDYQLPLASLGLHFRRDASDFPRATGGHLARPAGLMSPTTEQFLLSLPRPWTGVSWESYALTKNFRGRKSILASEFSGLTEKIPGSVINLQFPNPHRHEGLTEQVIPNRVITVPEIDLKNDVGAMVELMGQLDGVITIGNSVAHMCGAFGIPAKVLLPSVPDWRWGCDGVASHWYSSLTLHRNTSPVDWSMLLASIN